MPRPAKAPSAQLPRGARNRLGAAGELAAEHHLAALGFRVLARRHRCRGGEVDLVVQEGTCLCFVEVRTRSRGAIRPLETVTVTKQRRVYLAALDYLAQHPAADRALRFDVVEVHAGRAGALQVELWRNAFEAPE